DLPRPRPIVQSRRHVEGCSQAPVRHGWIYGVRAANPARANLYGLVDPLARWTPLAAATPRDLHQRYLRSHSLLLAGEIGRSQASFLFRACRLAFGLANRRLVPAARKAGFREGFSAPCLRRRINARTLNRRGES